MGRSSRSRSQSPAASRWPTACREMPSAAAASACVRPAAHEGDRLPGLVAAPLDDDGQRAQHGLRVAGVGGHGTADREPGGPLLGGVDGPAGAEERRPGAARVLVRQRASARGRRRRRCSSRPTRTSCSTTSTTSSGSRGRPGTRRRPSARRPARSGRRAFSSRQDVGDAVGGPPAGPLVHGQHVRHLASLTAFIGRCKPQSLSTTSGGKPPVAIGPQPVIVIRSSDLPWRRHRGPVLVPVGVLAADRAVVLDQRLQRLGQVEHLRLAVDLHPRAVPVRRTGRTATPPGRGGRWPPSRAADRSRRRCGPRRRRRRSPGDSCGAARRAAG